ncbi:MAG: DNA polymerase III subunit beta [Candidatus Dependentiae bacterium]|nr:DNA polymerase III subunit beta [Candidatus Dependentiae bacterium]
MDIRFRIEKDALFPLLSSLQPLCAKRTTLDVTNTVLFQVGNRELVLKGTDLEVSLQASCAIDESSCTSSGTFLVSGRRVFESVKEIDGAIACSFEHNQLVLAAEGVTLRLNTQEARDFPAFPERIENLAHIAGRDLITLLERVAFLIPQNNSNVALNGLFLEVGPTGLSMTTTNGHCLARVHMAKYTLEEAHSWLIPRRAVFELKKLIENAGDATVFLGTCDGHLVFSGELFNFFTRLISQPFPEYRPVLAHDDFSKGSIDRRAFIRALRRSACLLSGQFLATRFQFGEHDVHISFSNSGVGMLEEHLPIQFAGEDLDMRFYAPYVLDGMEVFGEERVGFYLKNETRPFIFETASDQCTMTYLVMPISPAVAAASGRSA